MRITALLLLLHLLVAVFVLHAAADARHTSRDSLIVAGFRRRESIGGAPAVLERLRDQLGPDMCFTERDATSLIQLCLEHGFRRLEAEITRRADVTKAANLQPLGARAAEELASLFDAAAAAPLDEAFSQPRSGDRRFVSPVRADYARTDVSDFANVTMEVYGRYTPSASRLVVNHETGVANMVFPGGDPCFHHHEHREMPWTTHFKLMCSFADVGRRQEADEQPPIKWDVRVNAPLCIVNVFVWTQFVC